MDYFRQYDSGLIDEGHAAIMGEGFYHFLKGQHYRPLLKGVAVDAYLKFAFVRNPFDRLVSAFYEFKKPEQFFRAKAFIQKDANFSLTTLLEDFNEFARMVCRYDHIHWKSQFEMLSYQDQILVDLVGKVETLDSGLSKIRTRLNLIEQCQPLPMLNKTHERKHYSEYYNNETKNLIANKYEKDLKHFNYRFEENN